MVGASKILTVSYGTFSCTLEGFDDPFTAMKAIAEYFRELAADDRYFGAEPPTPDTEMLHRIAEREVQRRVEASVSDNHVVLRAKADEAPTVPQEPIAPEAAPAAEGADETDSIAAKLMRIRAVVAASRATAEAARPAATKPAPAHALADDHSDLADDFRFGLDLDEDPADVDFDDTGLEVIKARSLEVADAPAEAPATSDEFVAEEEPPVAEVEDEAVETFEEAAEAEDDVADMVEEAADDDAIEAVEETVTAEAEDEAVEVVEEFTPAETEDDTADAVEETVVAEVEDDAVDAVEETVAVEVAAEAEDDAVEEAIADEAENEPVEAVAASEGALDLSAWRTDDPLPADIPEIDPDQDEDRAPVSGAHARVIKIQRAGDDAKAHPAEPETPVEESTSRSAIFAALVDDIDPDADEEPQNEELEAEDDATLLAGIDAAIGGAGDKTEDDLARELAEFAREARRDAHEGRAILESTSGDGEASVERLMEEAKSKLEGVENRRRFTAISHLKAAVAATVADRKLSSTHDPIPQAPDAADADMNRYRDDLSKAVRPRRPEAPAGSTTPRPKTEIPATPLVLVTEQRIDEGDHDHDEAVRPRRISAGTFLHDDEDDEDFEYSSDGAPISPDDAKSFAEFAERLGANGLPELLEAAAAYTATVEGQPHFSRPEILRKVADVTEETDFSREAGLRTFGLLLREGKIQKISRGQFTITGTSKFLAEEKTASR